MINTPLFSQNHLLLSEITLQPVAAEFIEIFNPTNSSILLDNYYIADNQNYPYVPLGSLPTLDPGDFIVQFPQGSSIDSNETKVIAIYGYDFANYYTTKADFEIYDVDAGTANMIIISESSAMLSNIGEGIALFNWNGVDAIVKDVDLMNVGSPTTTTQIVDKSLIAGYLPDAYTMPLQDQTLPLGSGLSTKRILLEALHEIHINGNGITGDDETSENIHITWDDVYSIPTPGICDIVITGIKSSPQATNTIKIIPNPIKDKFTIDIGNKDVILIEIYDFTGKLILSHSVNNRITPIDSSNYKSGIYLIKTSSQEKIFTQKVVKF
jgi:type IX secretion system substrate protein